ncbi:hypothetical protein FB451DRAFT_1535411 [Mycena latifolia]|nr:hypothetical protein FB451DRAFT_1535411 [Mycena latifolia]
MQRRTARMEATPNPLRIQELIDECITFLRHSFRDLKACALVSRSWTSTTRRHISVKSRRKIARGIGSISAGIPPTLVHRKWLLEIPNFAPALKTIEVLDVSLDIETNAMNLSALPNLKLLRMQSQYYVCFPTVLETFSTVGASPYSEGCNSDTSLGLRRPPAAGLSTGISSRELAVYRGG